MAGAWSNIGKFASILDELNRTKKAIFKQYCVHNSEPILRVMFEQNLLLKKQHRDFRSDMVPLLTEEVNWNFDKAILLVEQKIISKLSN